MASSPHPDGGPGYRENLTPSPGAWAALLVVPVGLALCLLPLGPRVSGTALIVLLVGCVAALHNYAGAIRIVEGPQGLTLHAGRAAIPVKLLRGAEPFVDQAADAQRRHLLDPRAYLMLRGWVPGLVKVELNDPNDPTPYWLISTRRPDALARVINDALRR